MKTKKKKSFQSLLEQIGESLGELRIKKGYTSLKEFAEDHNLPMIQYWRIEKGKANVTLKSLVKLLAIHRLTLQDFFCYLQER